MTLLLYYLEKAHPKPIVTVCTYRNVGKDEECTLVVIEVAQQVERRDGSADGQSAVEVDLQMAFVEDICGHQDRHEEYVRGDGLQSLKDDMMRSFRDTQRGAWAN